MVDLHVHSFVSDGYDNPREIMKIAYEKNIKAIAITDHDSIEGILEAEKSAKEYNIKFLKGIELSTSYGDGRLLHNNKRIGFDGYSKK
jgi:predicted metal-dependent phosphoesterase TrpH